MSHAEMGSSEDNEEKHNVSGSDSTRQSRALPCVHANDPARVHVHEIENLMGHGVKARPRLDIVIVVVGDEDARGVHGKRPEAVEMDLLAHLHGGCHQHQATA